MTCWKHFSHCTLSYREVFMWFLNSVSLNLSSLKAALSFFCLPAGWCLLFALRGWAPAWHSPAPGQALGMPTHCVVSLCRREKGALGISKANTNLNCRVGKRRKKQSQQMEPLPWKQCTAWPWGAHTVPMCGSSQAVITAGGHIHSVTKRAALISNTRCPAGAPGELVSPSRGKTSLRMDSQVLTKPPRSHL